MHVLRMLMLAVGVLAVTVLAAASLQAWSGGALEGELVVLDGSADRFRIVGHGGSFRAPAGIPLAALDGKNVRVELGPGNRVEQIAEVPVPIRPIAHGWSIVRGQLIVADAPAGRFTFAGDTQSYVAPGTVDVEPYDGQMVEIKVGEDGRVSDLRLVAAPRPAAAAQPRACVIGDATIASGATLCRRGTTHRCNDGAWLDLQTACR